MPNTLCNNLREEISKKIILPWWQGLGQMKYKSEGEHSGLGMLRIYSILSFYSSTDRKNWETCMKFMVTLLLQSPLLEVISFWRETLNKRVYTQYMRLWLQTLFLLIFFLFACFFIHLYFWTNKYTCFKKSWFHVKTGREVIASLFVNIHDWHLYTNRQ